MTTAAEKAADKARDALRDLEAQAWAEYLQLTREQAPARYREIEPWAWTRLCSRIKAIELRRSKLR